MEKVAMMAILFHGMAATSSARPHDFVIKSVW